MRKIMLPLVGAVLCAGLATTLGVAPRAIPLAFHAVTSNTLTAATFFVQSISPDQLRLAYGVAVPSITNMPVSTPLPPGKIKILIMPGHEPQSGGTGFGNYFERDIVVDIANDLASYINKNPRFEVMVARDKNGWNKTLAAYFNDHASEIVAYKDAQAALMQQYLANGQIASGVGQVEHRNVTSQTALELYGINKWANEHGVAITLHLHLNDYGGRPSAEGVYTGFVVYVPDHQYSNAIASRAVGEAIAARLSAYHATSTLPQESAGVVEDQDLIAVGSNNSASSAAALIEYGYIYEKQFQHAATRAAAARDYAYATYLGLQDFFHDSVPTAYGTPLLPHLWTATPTLKTITPDMYALQSALHYKGLYPPAGKTLSDCPISGYYGECTKTALKMTEGGAGASLLGGAGKETLQRALTGTVLFSVNAGQED